MGIEIFVMGLCHRAIAIYAWPDNRYGGECFDICYSTEVSLV